MGGQLPLKVIGTLRRGDGRIWQQRFIQSWLTCNLRSTKMPRVKILKKAGSTAAQTVKTGLFCENLYGVGIKFWGKGLLCSCWCWSWAPLPAQDVSSGGVHIDGKMDPDIIKLMTGHTNAVGGDVRKVTSMALASTASMMRGTAFRMEIDSSPEFQKSTGVQFNIYTGVSNSTSLGPPMPVTLAPSLTSPQPRGGPFTEQRRRRAGQRRQQRHQPRRGRRRPWRWARWRRSRSRWWWRWSWAG